MSLLDTRRRVLSEARQLASQAVRRQALALLRVGDVVRMVDVETGEGHEVRRLTDILRDEDGHVLTAAMPERRPWWSDATGAPVNEWGEPTGLRVVFVAPWMTPEEADRAVAATASAPANRWTWAVYEQHMADTYNAVLRGETPPEEPWD